MRQLVFLLLAFGGIVARAERRLMVSEYVDRVAGAWLGKSVGVSYGAPTEFKYGSIVPPEKMPVWTPETVNGTFCQDDLYVGMSFLTTLETKGIDVPCREAGIGFANSRYRLWCANYNARENLRRGIAAPWSSDPRYHKTTDDIDYQIEADFSGILAPGLPGRVQRFGEQFGLIMNRGDGLYGGVFIGGLYSAAFFERNRRKVVESALKLIPSESRYAEMVRDMLRFHAEDPVDWSNAWRRATAKYKSKEYLGHISGRNLDAKLNGAMVLLGILWGDGDVAKTMYVATAGGFDSDCNPSTALGVVGTMIGAKGFAPRYVGKIDRSRKWEFTEYDFPALVRVCEKLAREVIVAEGGRIERTAAGECLVIPEQKVPGVWRSAADAGPERYSKEEMARIRYWPGGAQGTQSVAKDRPLDFRLEVAPGASVPAAGLKCVAGALAANGYRKFRVTGAGLDAKVREEAASCCAAHGLVFAVNEPDEPGIVYLRWAKDDQGVYFDTEGPKNQREGKRLFFCPGINLENIDQARRSAAECLAAGMELEDHAEKGGAWPTEATLAAIARLAAGIRGGSAK